MKNTRNGFSIIEILIVIVILGLLVAVIWLTYDRLTGKPADTQQTSAQKESSPNQGNKNIDANGSYLILKEWGLQFKIPSDLTDVKYAVDGDTLAFFAKPSGSNVQYRVDYDKRENGSFPYATGVLYRSNNATDSARGFATEGKKIGNYYYYTAWSFSSLATGVACQEIYGNSSESNCQANAKAFELVNQGDDALLNTIEPAR